MSGLATAAAPDYMTVAECAAYLRTTPKAIYHLVDRGQLPAARIGRRLRFVRQSIDATVYGAERVAPAQRTPRRAGAPRESV